MRTRADSSISDVDVLPDGGTILVAVSGGSSGWEALDWAVAESAACAVGLRIVHVVPPAVPELDPISGMVLSWCESGRSERGLLILEEATQRVRAIARDVPTTTHLVSGGVASSIRRAVRNDTLIVLGRGKSSPFGIGSTGWRVARRATTDVAVVQLKSSPPSGRSVGQVVVAVTDDGVLQPALAYAFGAASRRGTGLTMIEASDPRSPVTRPDVDVCRAGLCSPSDVPDPLWAHRMAYPEVQVRRRHVDSSAAVAVTGESRGAALLVIGAPRENRIHHALFSSVAHRAIRWSRCPVVVVRPNVPAKRR